ncbi:MAG: FixH family protein [Phycisphaerales bacterium]|nr:FixH family protein [Phycisphaerales bacterium]
MKNYHSIGVFIGSVMIACIAAATACCAPYQGGESTLVVDAPAQGREPFQGHVIESNAGNYLVQFASSPDPMPVSELCELKVRVLRPNGKVIATEDLQLFADAAMPHHGHGMNVVPQVEAQNDGLFLVDGMLFHMPGRWELYFDITENDVTERAQCVVFFE